MNEYNDRNVDEPHSDDDRPAAGWPGHNADEHTGEHVGEHTDGGVTERTDDDTPREEEPLVGEVWNDDRTDDRTDAGEHAGTGHEHGTEPFGTEEPVVGEPDAESDTDVGLAGETAADEPVVAEPVADGAVADEHVADEPVAAAEPAAGGARPSSGEEFTVDRFFDDEAADRFRHRWSEVKAVFVDDPSDAVRQASDLSGEAVEELTAKLGQLRQDLDGHWGDGQDSDTERLRVALRGYGTLIEHLLSR